MVERTVAGLGADLAVPSTGARGLVVFAHGSGSSRHSRRNQAVASHLNQHGYATLLLDLLTHDEDPEAVFDIALLAARLVVAIDWVAEDETTVDLPIGCFGASTGAAAALVAAAERPGLVTAVVSRGGRPDLAGERLDDVRAPTLLIVGGADEAVLELNVHAGERLAAPHRLEVVPGAGHLFAEPGALEAVAELATGWFADHLTT